MVCRLFLLPFPLLFVGCAMDRSLPASFSILSLPTLSGASLVRSESPMDEVHRSRVIDDVSVDQFTNAPLQRFKQVRLAAPIETVFDYVGDHERMSEWIPMMHRVTMDHSDSDRGPNTCGVGSVRTCEVRPDKIRERIVVWEPDRIFAYKVIDGQKGVPIDGGFGVVTFKPRGPRTTVMTWRIYYEPKKWNPKAALLPAMVNYQLNGGLKNLTKRFGGEVISR